MKIEWKLGDVVKLFDGAYGTGTIYRISVDGYADVARPYVHAHEVGGWSVGVEEVRRINVRDLRPAEIDSKGQPRNYLHGCYTRDDLKKVASGEWKL